MSRSHKYKIIFLLIAYALYLPYGHCVTPIIVNGSALPVALSTPGPNAAPQIAVSSNGQAIAIWVNFPNSIEIQGRFYDGTNWVDLVIDPAIISITPASGAFLQIAFGSAPRVAIDGFGNATLVWVNSFNQIIVARFSGPTLVSATQLSITGNSNISPTVSVNQDGTALVVWIQNIPYQVLSSFFLPIPGGGVWSPPTLFLPSPPQNNGTYPASFGLGNNNIGSALWLDAPTGIILSQSFSIP